LKGPKSYRHGRRGAGRAMRERSTPRRSLRITNVRDCLFATLGINIYEIEGGNEMMGNEKLREIGNGGRGT
jgi:hypothetical protein